LGPASRLPRSPSWPWDASYYPPLDEPLMPAAAGPVIVLPEDE
jgi:hypothetical protein